MASYQPPGMNVNLHPVPTHSHQCGLHSKTDRHKMSHARPHTHFQSNSHIATNSYPTQPHPHSYPTQQQGVPSNHLHQAHCCTQHPLPTPTYSTPYSHNNLQQHQTANDAQNKYLQQLVEKLQNANLHQSELFSDLKIKYAILEKELEHASRAKDEVKNSMAIVLEALTVRRSETKSEQYVVAARDPESPFGGLKDDQAITVKLKNAEHEIKMLREKNQHLTKELKNKELTGARNLKRDITVPDLDTTNRLHSRIDNPQQRPKLFEFHEQEFAPKLPRNARTTNNLTTTDRTVPLESTKTIAQFSRPQASKDSFIKHVETVELIPVSFDELMEDSDDEDEEVQARRKERQAYYNPPTPELFKTGFEGREAFGDREETFRSGQESSFDRNHARNTTTPSRQTFNQVDPRRDAAGFAVPLEEKLQNNPFTSRGELNAVARNQQNDCIGNKSERTRPQIFDHGLQYRPGEDDSNVFRTVMVTGLPKNVQIDEVVSRVRGGDLLSATLCDVLPIVGSMTCRLVFKREEAAVSYVEFRTQHPIIFPNDNHARRSAIMVELVETPTYPIQGRQHAQTRCLYIPAFPNTLSIRELVSDIACNNDFRAQSLMSLWMDEDRALHLHFANVMVAGSAYGILTRWDKYRYAGVLPCFDDDPCDGPMEELLQPLASSKPLFPTDQLKDEYSEEKIRSRQPSFNHDRTYGTRNYGTTRNMVRGNGPPLVGSRKLRSYRDIDAMIDHNVTLSYDSEPDIDENETARLFSSSESADPGIGVRKSNPEATAHLIDVGLASYNPTSAPSEDTSLRELLSMSVGTTATVDEPDKARGLRKPPSCMAGSKFAPLLPDFKDSMVSSINNFTGASAGPTTEGLACDVSETEDIENDEIIEQPQPQVSEKTFSHNIVNQTSLRNPLQSASNSPPSPFASFNEKYGQNFTPPLTPIPQHRQTFTSIAPLPSQIIESLPQSPETPETNKRTRADSDAQSDTTSVPSTVVPRDFNKPRPKLRSDSNILSLENTKEIAKMNPDEIELDLESDDEEDMHEVNELQK